MRGVSDTARIGHRSARSPECVEPAAFARVTTGLLRRRARVTSHISRIAQRLKSATQLTTIVIGGACGSLALIAARKRWPFDVAT